MSSAPNPLLVGNQIVVTTQQTGKLPPAPDSLHRAVHQIRLPALTHNYGCVESAATRQQCSVIVVVKADGYGHGAIATALHLADYAGADAFAVATLEEGIALRKAFESAPPGQRPAPNAAKTVASTTASLFAPPDASLAPFVGSGYEMTSQSSHSIASNSFTPATPCLRPPQIRILVLGPPVGFPRCFDDYHHHNIEVMCSGPEVANAIMEWVADETERRRTEVLRAANDAKAQAILTAGKKPNFPAPTNGKQSDNGANNGTNNNIGNAAPERPLSEMKVQVHPSATLSNVSGELLAKELRALLISQQAAKDAQKLQRTAPSGEGLSVAAPPSVNATQTTNQSNGADNLPIPAVSRKRLRWHALVDSGMGRLGFKTQPVEKGDLGVRRDTVEIIQEMIDSEVSGAPIEFYGMVTHMADASSTSDYTTEQISRFKSLLNRVRAAGISVPSVSTDNSAALLTTTLTHFDPKEILEQPNVPTRGFVRTGGAIFGQRPTFKQLRAVSTLLASVRHVAVLKKGESVGYDRAYIASMNVRIATLTIGFADGYPRELGNGVGKVAIRGSVFPVAGNVCMDMIMLELGPAEDKEGVGAQVVVGDTAVLWGPYEASDSDGLVRLQDIAGILKTTQSALTCGLDKIRVRREYVSD